MKFLNKIHLKKGIILLVTLFCSLSSFVSGQETDSVESAVFERFDAFSRLLSPEKLYIQTDRDVYCVGDTIFFKGYLKNSSALSEYAESNFIYVELISSMVEREYNSNRDMEIDAVRRRVKIKRMADGFSGYIVVPENLNTGVAIIRGYTYWMMNRAPEYMFYKNIEIRNLIKDDFLKELAEKGVKEDSKYTEIGEKNPYGNRMKENEDFDVQFMPESGRYLLQHKSVIAYKAVNVKGVGERVTGSIFVDGNEISRFESNEYGTGVLSLSLPFMPKRITAVVRNGNGLEKELDFPGPSEKGVVINLVPDTTGFIVNITNNGVYSADSACIVAYNASELYYEIPYHWQNSKMRFSYAGIKPGINNIAIVDKSGNVYADRPFFVYPFNTVGGTVSTGKESYGRREKVVCTINLADSDGPLLAAGDYSVSVSDNFYAPINCGNDDMVSYMLMSGELAGHVDNPRQYFSEYSPLSERISGLDLVMLTNGWRYYDLEGILKEETEMPMLGREFTQSLSGRVYGLFGTAKKSIVTFVAPSIKFSAMGELDTTGWFALDGLDFPDSTKFIVGAVGINGVRKRFNPILNDEIFAADYSYPRYTVSYSYSKEYREKVLSNYYEGGGDLFYSINPIYVTGNNLKKSENISPFPQYQFKEGQYRGEEELKPYYGYDVLTYIVATCPPLRLGDSTRNGAPYIECRTQRVSTQMGISSGWDEIIVFVNGILASCADLDGMMVADLEGFAYLTGADAAKFGIYSMDALSPRSVVMVKSKMYDRNYSAPNVIKGSPMGWQKPIRYYSPKYETAESLKIKEPLRQTLYWDPYVTVEDGEAVVEFYTSDSPSDYTITLEGFTSDKRPVSVTGTIVRAKQAIP